MYDRPASRFLWNLLLKAELVEDLAPRSAPQPPADTGTIAADSDRHALPWHWPPGSRRLLALLLASAATTLLMSKSESTSDPRPPDKSVPNLVLDANTAPARVLGALPHVGPALVRNWTAAREFRPFISLDDLEQRVKGLGPVGMKRIAPHVRVQGVPALTTAPVEKAQQAEPVPQKRASRRRTSRTVNASP